MINIPRVGTFVNMFDFAFLSALVETYSNLWLQMVSRVDMVPHKVGLQQPTTDLIAFDCCKV